MPVAPAHPIRSFPYQPVVLFVKGPVPTPWLAAAQKAGGSALGVGILLWHLDGMKTTPDGLVVTRKRAQEVMGLGRDALCRGLDRLEDAKLITTTRGRGKAIRVKILPANPTAVDAGKAPHTIAGLPPREQ